MTHQLNPSVLINTGVFFENVYLSRDSHEETSHENICWVDLMKSKQTELQQDIVNSPKCNTRILYNLKIIN